MPTSKINTGTKYYNPIVPGSYGGLSNFVKHNKKVKTWAVKQLAILLHKLVKLKFEKHKTIGGGVDNKWQCDLRDIQNLHADNDVYIYLLYLYKEIY